jgi:hypothetical protein
MAVIPSFNVKWLMGRGLALTGSIGYGTRFQYRQGGVTGGLGVSYAF